jgi:hypothetical protein
MFDEDFSNDLWQEIQDSSEEIFDLDIPELKEDDGFNLSDYFAGDYDY